MKEVIVAEKQGFCFGVRRAISIAEKHKGEGVIFGELVHNPAVTEDMKRKGKRSVRDMDAIADKTVFITAHGVSGMIKSRLAEKAKTVIDATCPLVARVHTVGQRLENEGYQVMLVGEHGHPESMGILGDLDHGMMIATSADAENLPHFSRIGVIAQTTIDQDHFWGIVEILKTKGDEVAVENTICVPTRERQDSARKLAKDVDAMVVVGGRNSSNTKRLKELTGRYCPVIQIASAEELDPAWFTHHKRIGVTAGASTPDAAIKEVVERIKGF